MVRADVKGVGRRLGAAAPNLRKYRGSRLDCKSAGCDALESCDRLLRSCLGAKSLSKVREYCLTLTGHRTGLRACQTLFERAERYLCHL